MQNYEGVASDIPKGNPSDAHMVLSELFSDSISHVLIRMYNILLFFSSNIYGWRQKADL